MSIAIMNQVWATELGGPTIKVVAMKLADCAHDDGKEVRPSVRHVARRSEMSERSVQYAIKRLRDLGVLRLDKAGGGVKASTYSFDLSVLSKLHAETQAKWKREDQEAAAKTGAKSAPVQEVHPPGAPAAPYPSVKPTATSKTKNPKPMQFVEGGGERLIPFSGMDAAGILDAAREQAARAELGIEKDRLPFSPSALFEVKRLCVDLEALVKKYLEKTKGKCIRDPSAYLVGMAREAVAKRDGVPVGMVARLTSRDLEERKAAIVEATDGLAELKERNKKVRTPNGSRLAASVKARAA